MTTSLLSLIVAATPSGDRIAVYEERGGKRQLCGIIWCSRKARLEITSALDPDAPVEYTGVVPEPPGAPPPQGECG